MDQRPLPRAPDDVAMSRAGGREGVHGAARSVLIFWRRIFDQILFFCAQRAYGLALHGGKSMIVCSPLNARGLHATFQR